MLTSTFCCLRGISSAAERRLWRHGILTWNDLIREGGRFLSAKRMEDVNAQVAEARVALAAGLADYFIRRLPPEHRVRMWVDFLPRLLALDIETDGLSRRAQILLVGAARPGKVRVFVKGRNLSEWLMELDGSPILVTYNGTRFDLPLLRARFNVTLDCAHLDLRDVLTAQGLRGGQKAAEARLGITRAHSAGMDGRDVAALWDSWTAQSDREAIERLVLYNAEDVRGLLMLGRAAYRSSMSGYPLSLTLSQGEPPCPSIEWFGSLTTYSTQHIVPSVGR